MPIYEYKSTNADACDLCKIKFEIRQGIDDKPLTKCPQCGASVKRLFSRNFIAITEALSLDETFTPHTEEEAESLGLNGGFAEDQIWE